MSGTDALVERILTTYDTITVVGASVAPTKAAHSVPAHMQRHGWRIIPVNPHASTILGEPVYRTVGDVPEQVGLVDVFRPPGRRRTSPARRSRPAPPRCGCSWASPRPRPAPSPSDAGLLYVEDRCLVIEQRRLGLDAPAR